MNQTVQKCATQPPAFTDTTLAISIECPDCRTLRNFKLTSVLDAIQTRTMSACRIETYCEQCNRRFHTTLGWGERKEGWTVVPLALPTPALLEDAGGLRHATS